MIRVRRQYWGYQLIRRTCSGHPYALTTMLILSKNLQIPDSELDIQAIHAQGSGGQHINKVATAIHLRFDIQASSLPEAYKVKLLALPDQRISKDGVIIIKAQRHRSQEKNREDALQRLTGLIQSVLTTPKKRRATKPSRSSQKKRLDKKTRHSRKKSLRGKLRTEE